MNTAPAVRINRMAAGGDGVGRLPDGRAVFVPRSAPDDVVELHDLQLRRRFARAEIGRLIEAGPDRIAPRCAHYDGDGCGGCQWQHLRAEAQLAAKRGIVGDALRRIAKLELSDPEIVPSEDNWGYRCKLTLVVAAGGRRIGLHRLDAPGEVFDLESCLITAPSLMDLWRAVSRSRALLPESTRNLVLRLDREGGRHLIVQVSGQRVWTDAQNLRHELEAVGISATLWWSPEGGAPRVVAGSSEAYPAMVFEQVHPGLGDRIRAFAIAQLGNIAGRHVWDLYAGIGETTLHLLEQGASVESVEVDPRAVAVAARHALPNPQSLVRRHVGRAEDLVGSFKTPDLVITNPPRSGMDERVVEAIRLAAPGRLVYVSCDPATLARDLARIMAGPAIPYRLTAVRAFDLFPQTAHIETVAVVEAA